MSISGVKLHYRSERIEWGEKEGWFNRLNYIFCRQKPFLMKGFSLIPDWSGVFLFFFVLQNIFVLKYFCKVKTIPILLLAKMSGMNFNGRSRDWG